MVQQRSSEESSHATDERAEQPIAGVTAVSRAEHWAVDVHAGRHSLVADEPSSGGGADAGASPFALLLSSLGACTVMTLRMYAERKGWPLERVDAQLSYADGDGGRRIERRLQLSGALDEGQREKLADIAERTPVTLAIKDGVSITTTVT